MPLVTQITRNGEDVEPANGWTFNALSAFVTAALKETDPDLFAKLVGDQEIEDHQYVDMSSVPLYYIDTKCPLWKGGSVTIKEHHRYGPEDHEVLTLEPGDVLRMWRESK